MANIKFSALGAGTPAFSDDMVGIDNVPLGLKYARRTMHVVKTADEVITSDSTLSDDAELVIALQANKVYHFYGSMYYKSGSTPDIKFACSIPAGATARRINDNWTALVKRNTSDFTVSSGAIAGTGNTDVQVYEGFVIMAGTAGNFAFQWAQNISNAGETTVFAGSHIVVWEE